MNFVLKVLSSLEFSGLFLIIVFLVVKERENILQ